jgi:hypothetical protein
MRLPLSDNMQKHESLQMMLKTYRSPINTGRKKAQLRKDTKIYMKRTANSTIIMQKVEKSTIANHLEDIIVSNISRNWGNCCESAPLLSKSRLPGRARRSGAVLL